MTDSSMEAAAGATESLMEHTASAEQLAARNEILDLFLNAPMAPEDRIFNLGLWARSGLLVKFLVMADIYKRAMSVPGIICEFGTWYGQNLVLLENLRAIYEGFNKSRKIVSFDTFDGYPDGLFADGMYDTGKGYAEYLKSLLDAHSRANVYGHLGMPHEIVMGDVCKTAPVYFRENAHETVALAILDIGSLEPTRAALRAIKHRLLPGSIVLLDEFTLPHGKGEALAWRKEMAGLDYTMERVAMYPSKSIAIMGRK